MKHVIFPALFLLIGCSTTPPIPSSPNIPTPPSKVESSMPKLIKSMESVELLKNENTKLESNLKSQLLILQEQREFIDHVITDAKIIREKLLANEPVSELELQAVLKNLDNIQEKNRKLELDTNALISIVDTQSNIITQTKSELGGALLLITKKEEEATVLRNQVEHLGQVAKTNHSQLIGMQKELDKQKVKAASAGVYKNWIIGLVVVVILWIVIKNILMIYFPSTKFRI